MKGKTTMTLIIGLICLILTAVMFMQFKTISKIDVTALENMKEPELKSEIASWKTKYEEVLKKKEDTNLKIEEYRENITNNQKTSELLTNDLNQLTGLIGLRDVTGSGVVITLEDNEYIKINPTNLLELINELKLSGAEAISINDERIVYNSYVVSPNSTFVQVNGVRLVSPYVVKAIGDPTYLESGLSKKQYGYIDSKKAEGISVKLERQDNITINKYNGDLEFKYAE